MFYLWRICRKLIATEIKMDYSCSSNVLNGREERWECFVSTALCFCTVGPFRRRMLNIDGNTMLYVKKLYVPVFLASTSWYVLTKQGRHMKINPASVELVSNLLVRRSLMMRNWSKKKRKTQRKRYRISSLASCTMWWTLSFMPIVRFMITLQRLVFLSFRQGFDWANLRNHEEILTCACLMKPTRCQRKMRIDFEQKTKVLLLT